MTHTLGTAERRRYGWAELTHRTPVVAASHATWTIVYYTGEYGVDEGGGLRIVYRNVSDLGPLQASDPHGANYVSARTSGQCRLRVGVDPTGHVRPWRKAINIAVDDGFLAPGDVVSVTIGDVEAGGPGAIVQSFAQSRFQFRVLVDCYRTGMFLEVPSQCELEVNGGPATRLRIVVPSIAQVECPFAIAVNGEDAWGNVDRRYDAALEVRAVGMTVRELNPAARRVNGVILLEGACLHEPGTYWIEVRDRRTGFNARSNPIRIFEAPPTRGYYWGDLHGQSDESVGTNTIDEYLTFARETARLDFVGHQANCFQITSEVWERIKTAVKDHHRPHEFVTFLGYEWSGLTHGGGDRNVYFLGDDGPLHRCGHWLVPDGADAATDCYPVTELFARLRGRHDVLLVPHVGGRYADLRYHDPSLEPLVEVLSTHGEFEWLLADALERGYRVGVTCGSDDHLGRPGACYPGRVEFGVRGGLLCVRASELTRKGIWEALWARRCYGTSGERILLDVRAGDTEMGGSLTTGTSPRFTVEAAGSAEIEQIELRRNNRVVATYPESNSRRRAPDRIRVRWQGAYHRGRGRAVVWDGCVRCSGTEIREAHPYAFDLPAERVNWDGHIAWWTSSTHGDTDGIVLALSDARRGTLEFESNVMRTTVDLHELGDAPRVYDVEGGLGRAVIIEREPCGVGKHVRAELQEENLPAGTSPYHIVVLQRDGHKAWSSPIWVTRVAPDARSASR